ncbi:hypothetical protein E3N88_02512 [Mikania micrantha]|uniref:Uncharacterized protein n=1 Tax=Mikania micrantha TaxID=192012 RepID=A0A5N6Q5R6_9ASTR|nr:hypothetical protein E3N88_02512 [Mikania micrantha]
MVLDSVFDAGMFLEMAEDAMIMNINAYKENLVLLVIDRSKVRVLVCVRLCESRNNKERIKGWWRRIERQEKRSKMVVEDANSVIDLSC